MRNKLCALVAFFAVSAFAEVSVTTRLPAGAPAIPGFAGDPKIGEKIELGKALFFDSRLSSNQTQSCATCHDPEKAFSNGAATAVGADGYVGDRNVPALFNRAWSTIQFWDGRSPSLEEQIFFPILERHEMGNTLPKVLDFLNSDATYRAKFLKIFSGPATRPAVAESLSAFIRSIVSGNSKYDRFAAGDKSAFSSEEKFGYALFFNRFKCTVCHSGYNFTVEALRPSCFPSQSPVDDPKYAALYKVPSLRNLDLSAPYLHNGSLATVSDVLDFYNNTGPLPADNPASVAFPKIVMTGKEKRALLAFLKTLNGPIYYFSPVK